MATNSNAKIILVNTLLKSWQYSKSINNDNYTPPDHY